MNKNKLINKVVLVLGGTGDIGSVVADFLVASGAVVCRHGRSGKYAANVGKKGEIKKVIDKIKKEFGRIDVVINSISAPIKINNIDKKEWSDYLEHLNVQFKIAVDVVGFLVEDMKKNKYGHLINIVSSVTIQNPPPRGYADYIAAKYAVLGFSKCLAAELSSSGIYVHCVSPDYIKTNLTKVFPDKLGDLLAFKNKSKRLTSPEDVAKVILGLVVKPNNSFSNILVSGGQVMD